MIFRLQNDYFDHKIGQNAPIKVPKFDPKNQNLEVIYRPFELKIHPKVGLLTKFSTENLDFVDHLSTYRAKNTSISGPFKAQNDAQTTFKQLQTNFQNVQKTTFLGPKMVKMTLSESQILT